jgi:hypothetical protein
MDEKARKAAGQRGKLPEKKVRELLERLKAQKAGFDYERKYDARSAGGRFQSQAGDFGFFAHSLHGLIEVKEVDHDFRLPRKNFPDEQRARLRLRELAGGLIIVLIYHTSTKLWRVCRLSDFREGVPSWDLSDIPTFPNVTQAVESIEDWYGGFPFR